MSLPRIGTGQDAGRTYVLLGNLVLALLVVGYPFSASVSQLLGADSNEINIGFRGFTVALGGLLAVWSIGRGTYRIDVVILSFLGIYSFRLLYDLAYSMFPNIGKDIQFYLAAVLIPALAMGGGRSWYNERLCLQLIAIIGGIGGILIVLALALQPELEVQEQAMVRAGFEFLNPISLGYHGLFIAAASLMLIAGHGVRKSAPVYAAIALLGGYLLILAASRGPFVALAFALGLAGFANTRSLSVYLPTGVALIVSLFYLGAPELILQRFSSVGEDASSLERFYVVDLTIQAALEHPFFGNAYVEPVSGHYPHNLVLEAALALGLGGAALMLWIQIGLIGNAWRLARTREWLLPFLAVSAVTNAWISGAIWGAGLLFCVALLSSQRIRAMSGSDRTKLNFERRAIRA